MCIELTRRRDDLLCGRAFANDGIAGNLLPARPHPPGLHRFGRKIDGACRIVVGHAGGVGPDSCPWAKNMKQDDARVRLVSLLQRKRDEPVQVAEIRCDQNYRWMGPSAESGVRHGTPLIRKSLAPKTSARCA